MKNYQIYLSLFMQLNCWHWNWYTALYTLCSCCCCCCCNSFVWCYWILWAFARAHACVYSFWSTFIFNVAKMKISYQWLVNTEWSWLWIDATIFGLFVLFHFIMLLIMLQLQLKWRSCLKNWHALDCDYDFCWKIRNFFVQWHITVHVITTTSLCNLFFSALSLPLFNF